MGVGTHWGRLAGEGPGHAGQGGPTFSIEDPYLLVFINNCRMRASEQQIVQDNVWEGIDPEVSLTIATL